MDVRTSLALFYGRILSITLMRLLIYTNWKNLSQILIKILLRLNFYTPDLKQTRKKLKQQKKLLKNLLNID